MAGRLKSSDNIANADNFATFDSGISISYFGVMNQINMEKYLIANKLFRESENPIVGKHFQFSISVGGFIVIKFFETFLLCSNYLPTLESNCREEVPCLKIKIQSDVMNN